MKDALRAGKKVYLYGVQGDGKTVIRDLFFHSGYPVQRSSDNFYMFASEYLIPLANGESQRVQRDMALVEVYDSGEVKEIRGKETALCVSWNEAKSNFTKDNIEDWLNS